MPRIRSIKPDFFHHEELADLSPLLRLLFVGLWTLADKEGRLEDRPKRIKAALFPWEDCDMDAMLAELDAAGFIHRYEVQDIPCIAIPSFLKHQRPHPKESALGLPNPPERRKKPRSREKKRPEINDAPANRSSPARKEILENGGGGGSGNGSSASAPPLAGEVAIAPPEPEKPDEYRELVAILFDVFFRLRKAKYAPSGRDWKSLERLRAAHPAQDIADRWAAGLQAQFKAHCDTFADLEDRWNAVTATAPPGRQRFDPNQGIQGSFMP